MKKVLTVLLTLVMAVTLINLNNSHTKAEGDDNNYLCFTAVQANSAVWFVNNGDNNPNVKVSIDGGNTFNTWSAGETNKVTLANVGDKIYVKGSNATGFSGSSNKLKDYTNFAMSGGIAVSGSVMSLIDELGTATEIPGQKNCFYKLFRDCNAITSINDLVLPATTLKDYCYREMFYGCTGLSSIPEGLLPATTLTTGCYWSMFQGCTGLTSIPSGLLPATTLTDTCYGQMFCGCTSLSSIPEDLLPAGKTTGALANSCYSGMFLGCTGITSIPQNLLSATTLATGCYSSMFSGCTGITSIPKDLLPATVLEPNCYSEMFKGCTGLSSIPEKLLPATSLKAASYYQMFQNCTGLINIPELPASTLDLNCYSGMFSGCSKIKVIRSDTKVDNYVIGLKLPTSTATTPTQDMFANTGGAFKGTLELDKQYYVATPSTPKECSGNACAITVTKGSGNIVAHIDENIITQPSEVTSLEYGAESLTNGKQYVLYKGSVGIIFNKSFVDTLGVGEHIINVNYDGGVGGPGTYPITITVNDVPSPSDPSKKDESCEKVIGPTWHWNNDKGICEDYGVVGTSTR